MLKKEQWFFLAIGFTALVLVLLYLKPPPNRTGEGIPPRAEPHQNSTRAPRDGQNNWPGSIDISVLQAEADRPHGKERQKEDQPWVDKFWGDPNAFFACCVFLAAIAQALIAGKQWQAIREANEVAKKAGQIAESAARTTERAFLVAQRPWLEISVQIDGPLEWDKRSVHVACTVVVKNAGKDPAFEAEVHTRAFILGTNSLKIPEEFEKFCMGKGEETAPRTSKGGVIFPGQISKQKQLAWFPREERRKAISLQPVIFVCVYYRSNITNQRHKTGMVFYLLKIPNLINGNTNHFLFEESLAMQQIEFAPDVTHALAD